MPRVVSLIASATEIVAALGCEEWLIGRSHECDFPSSVASLPVCSEPRIDVHASSREIDRQVKAAATEALSIYRVQGELLERLRPTLILTQTQCDVCAVSLKDVEEAICRAVSSRPRIVALGAMGLAGVWDDIRRVAEALGLDERGEALVESCESRLRAIAAKASPLPRPRVACLEWLDPLMAAGNWVPELVEIAGGANLFGEPGRHSPWMTWDGLVAADPDVLVALPCGFDLERTRLEMAAVASRPEWGRLRAVREGRVYVTDGNQFFNRPGPRLVESAEILAEILHPGHFRFGHEGTGWQRMADTARIRRVEGDELEQKRMKTTKESGP